MQNEEEIDGYLASNMEVCAVKSCLFAPFIIVIGKEEIERVYLVLPNKVQYVFFDLIAAIEAAVKISVIMKLSFPLPSVQIWEFFKTLIMPNGNSENQVMPAV